MDHKNKNLEFCILKHLMLGQILTCPYFGGSNIGFWKVKIEVNETAFRKAGGQKLVQYPTLFRKMSVLGK